MMIAKKFLPALPLVDCVLNCKAVFILPHRGLRYNKKGGLIGGKKKRLPFNWRDMNFNPAQIPSAWIPKDWDDKQRIDYNREQELAKYIPGFKPKIPDFLQDDYHPEPLFTVDHSSKLSEGLKQALFLTKSIIAGKGLPEKIKNLAETALAPKQDDLVIQVFRHAHLFDVDPAVIPKVRSHHGVRQHKFDNFLIFPPIQRYCPLIMQELIRLCQTRGYQLSDDFHKRLLLENIASTACFKRECTSLKPQHIPNYQNNWKIRMTAKPDIQLQSQDPLALFANQEAVQATKNLPLASIYPTMPIVDVEITNRYDMKNSTGIPFCSSQQFLHTMSVFNVQKLPSNLVYSNMLTQLFSALYSKAVQLYGSKPQVLPEPLAAQGVSSDGRLFQFMCFQLNTTKLNNDDEIKNMVWVNNESIEEQLYNVDDEMETFAMYGECSHEAWKSPDYYSDYNPEVFKLFQGFWLNGIL